MGESECSYKFKHQVSKILLNNGKCVVQINELPVMSEK